MTRTSLALAAALAAFLVPLHASAQGVAAADVRIQSIQASLNSFYYLCVVGIYMDNDDSAPNTSVKILLPLEVQTIATTPGCVAKGSPAVTGVVECNLGTLNVGESRLMAVWTTLPDPNYSRTCSAFIQSDTPDPNRSNNYLESRAPAILP